VAFFWVQQGHVQESEEVVELVEGVNINPVVAVPVVVAPVVPNTNPPVEGADDPVGAVNVDTVGAVKEDTVGAVKVETGVAKALSTDGFDAMLGAANLESNTNPVVPFDWALAVIFMSGSEGNTCVASP